MTCTERIVLNAVGVTAFADPVRQHNPKKPAHARIQKKWNKRFGLKTVQRINTTPEGFADIKPVSISRRTLQKLQTLAREANQPTPEQVYHAWTEKLTNLCDRMIAEAGDVGVTEVTFHVADSNEHQFVLDYMRASAPHLTLHFTINEVPV